MATASKRNSGQLNLDAYARLRSDIISGELLPGQTLSEVQLAERYGFGKAAIRNALTRLIQDELMVSLGRRGHQVATITLRDFREVYQTRKLLEPEIARLAATIRPGDHLQRLRAIVDAEEGGRQDALTFLGGNRSFHITLAQCTGNERLAKMIGQLQDLTSRIMYFAMRQKEGETFKHIGHLDILRAIDEKAPEQAAIAMREHLRHGEEMVMASLLDVPELWDINLGSLGQTTG